MNINLDKINPKFRQLTDLLFFSDRFDLDLSDYKYLLKSNYNDNYYYLWDRIDKCCNIFWENGEKFWSNRISFIYSLNDKQISQRLEAYLENRMFNLIKIKPNIHIKYDVEYLQFIELCKVRYANGESLSAIKARLVDLPSHVRADKLLLIINSFIPLVFTDLSEYIDIVARKITQSSKNFDLLKSLENQGFSIDKLPMFLLLKELLLERTYSTKNRKAFFTMLNDKEIFALFKSEYQPSYKTKLLQLLSQCDYNEIEENHLRNIKCLLELDSSIADELTVIYANKLYARHTGHKRANADRLIRLLKTFPTIVPKKLLAYLSSKNKMSDIKYMLTAFPDLKKLAAFV